MKKTNLVGLLVLASFLSLHAMEEEGDMPVPMDVDVPMAIEEQGYTDEVIGAIQEKDRLELEIGQLDQALVSYFKAEALHELAVNPATGPYTWIY